ncbi:MAG: RNA methyltransferase [Candidatus Latescibacteria bacterium]|nr:RNA methyltransferase [Candidatus Latescibacterota bacterium]
MSRKRGTDGMETSFAVRTCDSSLSLEEYQVLPKHPLYLVLDNLRSAFNVGSLFRTADTARLAGILTCGYTAHPPHPKLDKTALGTLAFIPTTHFATTLEAVESFRAQGIAVWGVETTSQSRNHTEVQYPRPLALVLGNEALGVERPVLEACDELVQIPMYGFKNSLNVAAAGAVVVFEVLRQWGIQGEEG